MDASLVVLKRFIEEAGYPALLPVNGDTTEQLAIKSRAVQNLIYLAQVLGDADIGYQFQWNGKAGRTSEELKKDLNEALCKDLKEALRKVDSVLSRFKARIELGLGPLPMSPRETRQARHGVDSLEEARWRIQSAVESITGSS